MNTQKLKLRLQQNHGLVVYPTADEQNPLFIRVEHVSLDGEVTVSFVGDKYSIWRENVYRPGQMNKDRDR